ncbi:ParA family protein [Archaeoglobus neptunius]|uniref:ParA family protein n=1 Tax=Archaeoglobus neptunius TaxID=2798580 RepID=UPI00192794E7|nr:ParA family protein [Archaeoglobus neptunius]
MIKLACVNQKGGTGKTTTVLHLSYILGRKGLKVLAIDLDPQAHLTSAFGIDPDTVEVGMDDVLESYTQKGERTKVTDITVPITVGGAEIMLAPSNAYLERLNITLLNALARESVLSSVLEDVDSFDVVLIDCQPTLSILTLNALVAANYILIPVETKGLSVQGLLMLFDTIEQVKEKLNRNLQILGILPVRYQKRLKSAQKNLERLSSFSDVVRVYPPVPESAAFEEMIEDKKTLYDVESTTAKRALKIYEQVASDIVKLVR